MGATNQAIGYAISFQTFICLCINISITYLWYWSKSINFTVVSQAIRPQVDAGLWKLCSGTMATRSISSNCANIDPLHMPSGIVPGYVHAIRAFMIIAITLNLAAFILSLLSNSCSNEFKGKARGRIALVASILDLITNILVIFSVSYWAGKTMSTNQGANWVTSAAMNGMGGVGFGTSLQFTIGTCVILGWVFGSIGFVMSVVGLWSYFVTDYEEEDRQKEEEILRSSYIDEFSQYPGTHTHHSGMMTGPLPPQSQRFSNNQNPNVDFTYTVPTNTRTARNPSYDLSMHRDVAGAVPNNFMAQPQYTENRTRSQAPSYPASSRYQPGYKQKGKYKKDKKHRSHRNSGEKVAMMPDSDYL